MTYSRYRFLCVICDYAVDHPCVFSIQFKCICITIDTDTKQFGKTVNIDLES